jgi:hypothetical protein
MTAPSMTTPWDAYFQSAPEPIPLLGFNQPQRHVAGLEYFAIGRVTGMALLFHDYLARWRPLMS